MTLGAVVVGTGIGLITHVRALRAAGFEVRALVGRDLEKTATKAKWAGIPHAFASLDEALRLPGVDVATIATPPLTHAALVLEAIAAGKHVLCEKPLARDAKEALTMLRAAEKAGVVHLFGTEFRFFTPQATLQRLIKSGAIGEPRFALFTGHMDFFADPSADVPAWFDSAEQGGSWLMGIGSHTIDQIRSTLGEFERVSATMQKLSPRPQQTADDLFCIHFGLKNGVEGIYHASGASRGPSARATKIMGTKGTAWVEGFDVWFDNGAGAQKAVTPNDLVAPPPIPPAPELLQTAYDRLHDGGYDLAPCTRVYEVMAARIRGEKVAAEPAAATFADGVALQAVFDAVKVSAREHRTVAVELPV
jgi:predicted dehydrogenase